MGKSGLKYASVLPALIMMVIIFCFSSQPGSVSSDLSSGIINKVIRLAESTGVIQLTAQQRNEWNEALQFPARKAAHMIEYAILGILIAFPFWVSGSRKKGIFLYSFLTGILYAASDEIHQLFVPGRAGQIRDVIIDGIGVLLGCSLFIRIVKRIKTGHTDGIAS